MKFIHPVKFHGHFAKKNRQKPTNYIRKRWRKITPAIWTSHLTEQFFHKRRKKPPFSKVSGYVWQGLYKSMIDSKSRLLYVVYTINMLKLNLKTFLKRKIFPATEFWVRVVYHTESSRPNIIISFSQISSSIKLAIAGYKYIIKSCAVVKIQRGLRYP
jgi:hypothetical protein